MMHADSPEDVVQLYLESIVRVEDAGDIASDPGPERTHTDLVVDGDIPPSAIVAVRPDIDILE